MLELNLSPPPSCSSRVQSLDYFVLDPIYWMQYIYQLILEEYFCFQGFRGLEVNMFISLVDKIRHQNITKLKSQY